MKMLNKAVLATTLTASLFAAGVANAASTDPILFDFTDLGFNPGSPTASHAFAGVTITSTGGDIAYFDDGLGVMGGDEDDEIDGLERLFFTFGTTQVITGAWIADAYTSGDGDFGTIRIGNGPTEFEFTATMSSGDALASGRELYVDFGGPMSVDSLLFFVDSDHTGEFAVNAVTTSPVPLPAPIMLLGSALIGLFGFRRKIAS